MAGLEIGQRGGIRVDEHMRTANPDIFAVGDAVEVKDFVTGQWTLIPLAGPANRQGRIAADVYLPGATPVTAARKAPRSARFSRQRSPRPAPARRSLSSSETRISRRSTSTRIRTPVLPGRKMLAIKVLFRKSDGRLLGAQVLGEDGVPKRIDSFAMAIQMGCTVYDLEEAELCYARHTEAQKTPSTSRGWSGRFLRGDMPICHWTTLDGGFLLDVRNPPELAVERVPGRINIPLPQLRARLESSPATGEILVICRSGCTRLLRDAHPSAERLPGVQYLRRHAVTLAPCRDEIVEREESHGRHWEGHPLE